MSLDTAFFMDLPERITLPEQVREFVPLPAFNILSQYYETLNRISQIRYPLRLPLNIDLNHPSRIDTSNPQPHPGLPLFETPYLATTGILNGDIPAETDHKESYYRELVGLSLVKTLEVIQEAHLGNIQWSVPRQYRLKNGRELIEINAKRQDELAQAQYVPTRRELAVQWYDQDPKVPPQAENFIGLRSVIRINSEKNDHDDTRPSCLNMDIEVNELVWAKNGSDSLRIIQERPLVDKLLGEKKTSYTGGTRGW